MKKLLVLALGMFVAVACSDDSSGAGEIKQNLETKLVRVESTIQDLGVVENGAVLPLTFKMVNKTAAEVVLTPTGGNGLAEDFYGDCVEEYEPSTLTIAGNQTCDAGVNFTVLRDNAEGMSPVTLIYKDANQEVITIVLARFTIKPVK